MWRRYTFRVCVIAAKGGDVSRFFLSISCFERCRTTGTNDAGRSALPFFYCSREIASAVLPRMAVCPSPHCRFGGSAADDGAVALLAFVGVAATRRRGKGPSVVGCCVEIQFETLAPSRPLRQVFVQTHLNRRSRSSDVRRRPRHRERPGYATRASFFQVSWRRVRCVAVLSSFHSRAHTVAACYCEAQSHHGAANSCLSGYLCTYFVS